MSDPSSPAVFCLQNSGEPNGQGLCLLNIGQPQDLVIAVPSKFSQLQQVVDEILAKMPPPEEQADVLEKELGHVKRMGKAGAHLMCPLMK